MKSRTGGTKRRKSSEKGQERDGRGSYRRQKYGEEKKTSVGT